MIIDEDTRLRQLEWRIQYGTSGNCNRRGYIRKVVNQFATGAISLYTLRYLFRGKEKIHNEHVKATTRNSQFRDQNLTSI